MSYLLSTEELKQNFGDIKLNIISQKEYIRFTCIRRLLDNAVLAYNTVLFHDEGVQAFGDKFHNLITSGQSLGEVIKNSGVMHERKVSEYYTIKVNFGLGFLFNTKKDICLSRKVEYIIKNKLYATIIEIYNPELTQVKGELCQDILSIENNQFFIDELKSGYEKDYLRLAHDFLKKPMHVDIENQDIFIEQTKGTLDLLMKDSNTKLFVAADSNGFIGYAAINIHPALHVNGLECVIRELYVKEEQQHTGIGTLLLKYVGKYAKERGCKRLSLATKWDDEKQRGFYESNGFKKRCDFIIKFVL